MKFKIKKKNIEILFPIIAFMEPELFSAISFVDNIWNVLKVIAILYIIISLYNDRHLSVSAIQFLSVVFCLLPIVSTLINGGDVIHAAKAMIPIMALIFYFDAIIRKYKRCAVEMVANLAIVYMVINALLLIVFPEGFGAYIPEYTEIGPDSRLNFLGKDNRFIYFFIFTIVLCYFVKGIKSKTTIFVILISFASMFFVWSGTGVVGILLFGAYLLFVQGKKLDKFFKFMPLTVLFVTIFILVVIYNVQGIFSNFIVSFLHKDITFTGRTFLWVLALEHIAQKPLLGYGITETNLLEIHGRYYSPHNIILQILMTGGGIQLLLFIALVLIAGRKLKDCQYEGMLSASIFIYLICSLTEATMLSSQLYLLLSLAYNIGVMQEKQGTN